MCGIVSSGRCDLLRLRPAREHAPCRVEPPGACGTRCRPPRACGLAGWRGAATGFGETRRAPRRERGAPAGALGVRSWPPGGELVAAFGRLLGALVEQGVFLELRPQCLTRDPERLGGT